MAPMMTYRELLAVINRDLCSRDESRLDLPVALAVRDGRGEVHYGHLVACSAGEIPGATLHDLDVGQVDLMASAPSPSLSVAITGDDTDGDDDVEEDAETIVFDLEAHPRIPAGEFPVGEHVQVIDLRAFGARQSSGEETRRIVRSAHGTPTESEFQTTRSSTRRGMPALDRVPAVPGSRRRPVSPASPAVPRGTSLVSSRVGVRLLVRREGGSP